MMSGGKPTAIMKAVTSDAQAKIGILVRLMPGARAQRMAAMISTAAATRGDLGEGDADQPEIRRDARREVLVVSGTYMNHPPSGAASKRKDDEHDDAAEDVAVIAERPEPRKDQVARAEHQRDE